MNTVTVSITKNLVLVALLVFVLANGMTHWMGFTELLWIQVATGLVYVFLSCYEFNNTAFKAQLPKERFAYFPNSFFMSIAIKTGTFIMIAVVLSLSHSYAKNLYPICVIIALTRIVVCILIIVQRLCFVSIYANYILIVREKLEKLLASEIENVEFRHEIVYFVKKDKSTHTVKTFSVENKKAFVARVQEWVANNNLPISAESLANMKAVTEA